MASDIRDEVPAQAYVNMQIIGRLRQVPAFREAKKSVARHYGLAPDAFELYNLGVAYVVSLLYCLIVVPKELWDEKITPEFLDGLKPKSYFRLRESDHAQSEKDFIRHLRNSIAHARFSIDGDLLSFWDVDQRSGLENFRASVGQGQLERFVEKVGSSLANLVRRESPPGAGFIQ